MKLSVHKCKQVRLEMGGETGIKKGGKLISWQLMARKSRQGRTVVTKEQIFSHGHAPFVGLLALLFKRLEAVIVRWKKQKEILSLGHWKGKGRGATVVS